jgi:hypothetical protein
MSLSVFSFFIFTPIPWATILCIILYRHNLSQIVHPFKDRCSKRDWKSVFDDLDIPHKATSSNGKIDGKGRASFSIDDLRTAIFERHSDIGFYASLVAIVTGISLLTSLIVVPVLIMGGPLFYSRFSLITSAGLQFVSAIPSIFAIQRCFGPFPSPPSKFHLKKRRLGSLLRYEEILNQQQMKPLSGTLERSEGLWRC